jgi:hypothetical protein
MQFISLGDFFGERSRLGCCSARLAPNIRGVAVTKS